MKRFFFVAAMSCTALISNAQSNVHLGIKGGVNIAGLQVENADDYDTKVSFHAGGLAHIHINRHFAIQPELVLSGQGAKYTSQANNTTKANLTYLNIPVLAQYMFGDGFRLETGPQLGFLLSAKNKFADVTVNVKDSYKTTDVSWAFGVGYLSDMGLGVDLRYNLGLSNINDASGADVYNRVFALGLFYQFMHNSKK
jgi:hypothetical protein